MCGIAGYVGGFRPGLARQMSACQTHRGPDDLRVYEDPQNQVALGHNRLAILDLTDAAAQPMLSTAGQQVLTYNGEIYNFRELRDTIGLPLAEYRSTGDTEVLLRGLVRWGTDFVPRLNGIFAFALWDQTHRRLLLARDPLGVKPLYYCEPEPGSLLFASELKALLCHPAVKTEIDPIALQQHLSMCHPAGSRTAIKGISRLPPGSMLSWDAQSRRLRMERYWRPDYTEIRDRPRADVIDELRNKIQVATQRQMVSDVPVGAFLSGGLDSSLLVHHAEALKPNLACFTSSPERDYSQLDDFIDDGPFAAAVAAKLKVPLTTVPIQSSSASLLPDLLYSMDEPLVDPAIINCYVISRQARELGIKVLLSGQGADELFGGYPRYRAMKLAKWFAALPISVRRLMGRGAQLLPAARGGFLGPTLRRIRRLLSAIDKPPLAEFLEFCSQTPSRTVHTVLASDMLHETNGSLPYAECLAAMEASTWSTENRCLEHDLTVYLPNHNLLYTDKMGMATGVETRVPFLDLELVQFVNRIPYAWKVTGRRLKAILRDAAKGIIDDAIIARRKAGFGAPFRSWLRNELGEVWADVSSKHSVNRRGWFSYEVIQSLRERSQSGGSDFYLLQWAIMTLELWARQMIDRRPSVPESNVGSLPIPTVASGGC